MHKKTVIGLLALAATSAAAWAAPVSPDQALSRARAEMSANKAMGLQAQGFSLREACLDADGAVGVYLFDNGKTMMILPADDRVAPVLGYTDAPAEGEMPPQLRWWIDSYSAQIGWLQMHPDYSNTPALHISADLTRGDAPAKASTQTRTPIAPLCSTVWNQDAPFNNLCPMVSGQRSVTGCVATACAQVLKYFNYPAKGTGSISYTTSGGTTYTNNFATMTFDWDNMLDSYNGTYTAAQGTAVATLMKACGYASQMNYSPSESGTQSTTMMDGAKKYLGMHSAAACLDRDNMSFTDWENLVYQNLKVVGPVYYSGATSNNEGHAFVCDGYSSDGYFHFNWGWGGMYNGYFLLTALNPEGQGIGGATLGGGFNFGQQAFFNFTKPGATTITLPAQNPLQLLGSLTGSKSGNKEITFTSDYAEQNNTLFFYNNSSSAVTFEYGIKAVNTATNAETIQGSGSTMNLNPNYGPSVLACPVNLPGGTYNVYLVTKLSGSNEWLPLAHNYSDNEYVNVTVSSSGYITAVNNVVPASLEAGNLSLDSQLYWGQGFKVSYAIQNQGTKEVSDGVTPIIFTITNGQASLIAKGETKSYVLAPDAFQNCSQQTSMLTSSTGYTQNAYLGLLSQNTGSILTYKAVTVNPKPTSTSIASGGFSFVGNTQAADANSLQFKCTLKCTAGYYANPLNVYITAANGGAVLQTFTSPEFVFLSSGQSDTRTFGGSFGQGVKGTTYAATFGNVSGGYVQSLATLNFKISTEFSSIEAVEGEANGDILVIADRASQMVMVTAPSAIAAVEVYGLDGRLLAADANVSDTSASLSVAQIPAGVAVVKVTLADGTQNVVKIVK